MKWVIALLIVMIGYLQYRVWFGEGSFEQIVQLQREIDKQKIENSGLVERNRALNAEIKELKEGTESIEARARLDMGMIKEGETFYFIPEIPEAPFATVPIASKVSQATNKPVPKKP